MNPKFRLISENAELQILESRLAKFFPISTQMFNLVRLKLQKRFPFSMQIEIYLYEDPRQSGAKEIAEPFVVCTQKPNLHTVNGVITLAPHNSEITPLMLETFEKFIDWENVRLFSNGNISFTKHLKVLTDKHGNRTEHPEGILGAAFFLDVDTALEFPDYFSEDEIKVKKLCVEDSDEMVRNWKWALPHSKKEIEESIKSLDSVGVYVDSKLASSAVLSPLGLINILHTDENHRRKGFGEITMQALAKSVALSGLVPGAEIESWNDKSRGLLEKVGFKWVFDVEWMYFEK